MNVTRKGWKYWIAYNPDYPGAVGEGLTKKLAIQKYESVLIDWAILRKEQGLEIPRFNDYLLVNMKEERRSGKRLARFTAKSIELEENRFLEQKDKQ